MKHHIKLLTPGTAWDQGLMIGNGRLGACVTGQVEEEILTLNEETMCWGGPRHRENPDCRAHLPRIRQLLMEGRLREADFLSRAAFHSGPRYLNPYVPAAELRIHFYGENGAVQDYQRDLDLDRATASVRYSINGLCRQREYFVSRRRNVIALRLTGDAPITCLLNLNRRPYEQCTGKADADTVFLRGQCGSDGVSYFCGLTARVQGGSLEVIGDTLAVRNAGCLTVYLSIATDFGEKTDFAEAVLENLKSAGELGWDALLQEHLQDYREYYDRCSLSLGGKESGLPTDLQLKACRETGACQQELSENLFALGRYLLISSSLDCQLPANLQGIWNGSFTPSWESLYTININLQMNYWPAEVTNLSECTAPLFSLLKRMEQRGRTTARELYGCEGSVAHHNTNMWGDTAPEGIYGSAPIWPMGLAWLSLHLYEHYLYCGDQEFLRREALPILESSVRFFLDYLTEAPDGRLLTGPSMSPENSYVAPSGEIGSLCMAPTMDSQILRELFRDYLQSCRILESDSPWIQKTENALAHLPENQIAKDGRILEWSEPYEETEPGHRHISHLFGLYPGNQMNDDNPALRVAAEKTLEYRLSHGGGHTGWSCAWILCLYARLRDRENTGKYLKKLLTDSTLDNLMDYCPPTFQIDGSFGALAGMAEALVQSQNGFIELLPALPPQWPEGSVRGLRVRGGAQVDVSWRNGTLLEARIRWDAPGTAEICWAGKRISVTVSPEKPLHLQEESFRCTGKETGRV